MKEGETSIGVSARLEFDRDHHGDYDVLIDHEIRFRIVRDKQWPNFWSLHPVTVNATGRAIATECEHWDLITQLEQGMYIDAHSIRPSGAS